MIKELPQYREINRIFANSQETLLVRLKNLKLLSWLKNHKGELILLLTVSFLIVLVRLPYLEKPLDEDSAANAYGARLILQGEPLYRSYHPGHHLPAIYYIFALAFSLFGDSPEAIRFFLALWLIPTVWLLYFLSRTITDKKTSYLAVGLFLLLSTDYVLEGHTAEIELFANLPRLATTLLLLKLIEKKATAWQFSLIGLVGAIVILFKAVYVSPLALTGIILLTQFWSHRKEQKYAGYLPRCVFWMGTGFLLGLLPVILYFSLLGLLPRLALVFTLGQIHVSSGPVSPIFIFLYPLSGLAIANAPLLVLGLTGALLLILNGSTTTLPKNVVLLWFLMSFIEAGASRNPFLHYYQLIAPPLSLLAAWSMMYLYRVAKAHHNIKRVAWVIPALLLLAIGGSYLFSNGGYLFHYLRYKTSQETYQDFVLKSWPPTGPMLVAIQDVATHIQSHSQPDEHIYLWGSEVQLYYLADRRCATDFIWPIYLDLAPIPGGPTEMQGQVLATTTKFIVVAQDNPPTWLANGLAEHYYLVKTISHHKIYQRLSSSEQAVQN
jgi:hypothetical protein